MHTAHIVIKSLSYFAILTAPPPLVDEMQKKCEEMTHKCKFANLTHARPLSLFFFLHGWGRTRPINI